MQNIKLVRLVSGEELIAEIFLGERTMMVPKIKLGNPLILVPTKERSIALSEWMPYSKTDGMEIDPHHVMFMVPVDEELCKHYIQVTSGIIT